jgi:glycerol dehydrogenase
MTDMPKEGVMSTPVDYKPGSVFSIEEGNNASVPRVFIAPNRYIQGDGILDHLGRYLTIVPSRNAAILISEGGRRRVGERLLVSLSDAQIDSAFITFDGECSLEEIDRIVDILLKQAPPVDCLVAVGGGKCVDAGKCVAYRLGIPVVICPSLASNDAPCSALSVIYTPDGVSVAAEFFPASPAIVAVDTRIVAEAPVRYLVAGMGDAIATRYEAKTCFQNPKARSTVGARPTLAAGAIGELCATTLFAYGVAGADAVNRSEVNEALERVVEANTLLSGLGFESGGLAASHSVAQALTVVPEIQQNYLHGEMVALGLLTQLLLEGEMSEARKVAQFFMEVGLPVHFGQLSLSVQNKAQISEVMEAAVAAPIMANEPFTVDSDSLIAAALEVNELGLEITESEGDAAFRALHKL